jgi:hypothetical protein
VKNLYVALFLVVLATAIASDSSGQSKENPPKASQQSTAQQERGTEQSPVTVKVLKSEKSPDELKVEQEKQEADRQLVAFTEELAKYTQKLFIATSALAAITLGLFFVAFRQVSNARRAIKVAEDSAAVARKALTELERPYLFILDYNWLLIGEAKIEGHISGSRYFVANGGRLPAFIKAAKFGLAFRETIPSINNMPEINDLLTAPLLAGGEKRRVISALPVESESETRECQIRSGLAAIPQVALETKWVIAKISIEYDGPTTTGHVTTACWEWHPGMYAFRPFGGSEHNQRT